MSQRSLTVGSSMGAETNCNVLDKHQERPLIVTTQQVQGQSTNERAIALQKGSDKRPFFYLHGDWTGHPFYCFSLAEHIGKDQPFFVLDPFSFETMVDLPPPAEIAPTPWKAIQAMPRS